jgi:hypothetical protein
MSNKKISQLPSTSSVTDSDVLIINDNGITKTATREALLDGITRNVTDGAGNDASVAGDLNVANEIVAGGDIQTTGDVSFGTLTDHLTGVSITTIVDSSGGIETFDNSLATSGAIKEYLAADSSSGSLDSEQIISIIERGVRDVSPLLDSSYDLGSPTKKWRDLYLSGSTIHLGGATISKDGSNVVIANAAAVEATAFIGDGSQLTGVSGTGGGGLDSNQVLQIVEGEGGNGTGARAVKVLPLNGQVIRYDSDGQESDTLTFRAVPENALGSVQYKWSVKGSSQPDSSYVVKQTSASTDFVLPDTDEPGAEGVKVVKCEMLEDGVDRAQDIVSVYGLVNGFSITGFLTNESHVEPADENGALTTSLNDAGGIFKVFLGTTEITNDPAVTYSIVSNTGINVGIQNNGSYTLNSFASNGTLLGTAIFQVEVASSLIPSGQANYPIQRQYSVAKSVKGNPGTNGTGAGSAGEDARAVKLIPNNGQVIRYSEDGSTESDTLTFSADPNAAFTGTKEYQFFVKVPGGSFVSKRSKSTSPNYTLADADEPAVSQSFVVKVTAYENNVEMATDFVTIFGIANGTAVTGFLTNESHVEGFDSDGNLVDNLNDAGGTFKVFRGTTDITTACTFRVESSSNVGISINNNGVYTVSSFAAAKGVATLEATVPANLVANSSSNMLIDKVYSIARSQDGASAAGGGAGSRGPGRWYIGIGGNALPASSATAQSRWNDGTYAAGSKPTVGPVDGDQAIFCKPNFTAPTSQNAWIYNGSSWVQQTEFIDGNLLVAGTVTADDIAVGTTSGVGRTTITSEGVTVESWNGSAFVTRIKLGNLS